MNEITDKAEKIDDAIRKTSFRINTMPVWAMKEFSDFCKVECGDNYSVGLIQLLKIKKQYNNLIPLMSSILKGVEDIKAEKQQQPKGRKTFA